LNKKNTLQAALSVAAILVGALALAACGTGEEPRDRDFDLRIEDRTLDLDPAVIRVNQGDTVTLNIESDEHGSFHLHGYDIELEVGPDEIMPMRFTADATGNFRITFHPGAEEDEHSGDEEHEEDQEEIDIASLQVQPR
jgi:plastocyanin